MTSCKEIAAWNSTYKGDTANFFIQTLKDATVERNGLNLANYFTVIQTSGTGKSRLADEVAKQIFTIPICLSNRATSELVYLNVNLIWLWMVRKDYPPADTVARDNLVKIAKTSDSNERQSKYLAYFTSLFKLLKRNVDELLRPLVIKGESKKLDFKTLSEHWRNLLYARQFSNRNAIFQNCEGKVVSIPHAYAISYTNRLLWVG